MTDKVLPCSSSGANVRTSEVYINKSYGREAARTKDLEVIVSLK